MADKVIYFPHSRVPKNEWFTRVLLYWDEVGIIAPSVYSTPRLGKHTSELISAGLVRRVEPEDQIPKIPWFTDSFLKILDKVKATLAKEKDGNRSTYHIHINKTTDKLVRGLQSRGLIRGIVDQHGYPNPTPGPWIELDGRIGLMFMGYLASVLGRSPGLGMDPITDHAEFLLPRKGENHRVIQTLRFQLIEDMLPAPARPLSSREIAEFKLKHRDLLRRFRRRVEMAVIDISGIPDSKSRTEKLRLTRQELLDEVNEIMGRMEERNWAPLVKGALGAVLGTVATGLLSGDPAIAVVVGVGFGVAETFASNRTEVSTRTRELNREPLAYAALVRGKLLSQDFRRI